MYLFLLLELTKKGSGEKRKPLEILASLRSGQLEYSFWAVWVSLLWKFYLTGCGGLAGESRSFSARSKRGSLWGQFGGVNSSESSLEPTVFIPLPQQCWDLWKLKYITSDSWVYRIFGFQFLKSRKLPGIWNCLSDRSCFTRKIWSSAEAWRTFGNWGQDCTETP